MNPFRLLASAAIICVMAAGCGSDASDKTLAINVRGSVSVSPTSFSGYYIYESQEGEQIRRDLTGSGSVNEVFYGRRVLHVSLRRTSDDGLIGLVITSDGSVVYDSGMRQSSELILFEADT